MVWLKYGILCTRVALYRVSLTLVAELAIGQHNGRDQTPGVQGQAQPAGDDLHPHGRRISVQRLQRRIRPIIHSRLLCSSQTQSRAKYVLVPIGQRHHHVQRGRHEDDVEQRPRIGDALVFIVPHLMAALGGGRRWLGAVVCQHWCWWMGVRLRWRWRNTRAYLWTYSHIHTLTHGPWLIEGCVVVIIINQNWNYCNCLGYSNGKGLNTCLFRSMLMGRSQQYDSSKFIARSLRWFFKISLYKQKCMRSETARAAVIPIDK